MMATLFLCCVLYLTITPGLTQQGQSNANEADVPAKELIEALTNRLNRLETAQVNQQQRFDIERLEQQTRIETLEATVRKQNDVIASTRRDVPAGEGRTTRQTQANTDQVAFSAMADHSSTNWLVQLDAKHYFIFDVLYVDTHNTYNNQTGRFTAPIEGIYAISASIMAYNNHEVYGDVFINGKRNVARVYARGTDGRHDQGSQTVLLRLYPGDWVAVQNPEPFGESVYGGFYTSFSGFLVKQEGQLNVVG